MITAQVNSPLRHRVCFDLSSDSGAHVLSFRESQVKHVAAPAKKTEHDVEIFDKQVYKVIAALKIKRIVGLPTYLN